MGSLKKKALIIGIICSFLSIGFVGSIYAWSPVYDKHVSDCGPDNEKAGNGDVVTTEKWNKTQCRLYNLINILTDWPKKNTYFLTGRPSNGSFVVTEVNLPSSSSVVQGSNGYAGGIHFKDPSQSYANQSGYKGGIVYNETSDTIDIFTNGLRVTNSAGPKLLGWKEVDIANTDPFDPACQYRFTSAIGARQYYASSVTGFALKLYEDQDWTNEVSEPIQLVIDYKQKTEFRHDYPRGSTYETSRPRGHGEFIVSMEKLCLPSYKK